MIDFSYQSGDSFLHRLNPALKFVGLIVCSVIILSTNDLTGLLVSAAIIAILMILSKSDFRSTFRPLKRLSWFLIMIFLMNALFYSADQCLFSFWLICVSKGGLIQGANILLHTSAVTIISYIFIRTTTSVEIMKGMETLMRPLRVFGVPTRDIALIMSIALQFIPVFFSDFDRIRKAQIARGADFSAGSLKDRAKSVFPLVIPAFISAFRRADELSLAIEARGFQSEYENRDSKNQ